MVRVNAKLAADRAGGVERHRWLELIGFLKLLKCAFFIGLGFALLQMLHHDLYMMSLWVVESLHLDPDRLLIADLLDKISLITNHRLKQLAALVFIYASLDCIEGIGLILEKRWAEYFTLGLTIALLPLEFIKLVQHPNHWTLLVLLVNIVIAIYLAWLVRPLEHSAPGQGN